MTTTTTGGVTTFSSTDETSGYTYVVLDRSTNLGLIGEYTEMPKDSVFMVSYSTKSAQRAVYKLLSVNKEITPVYHGTYNPWNWIKIFYWLST